MIDADEAQNVETSPCRKCGEPMIWVRTRSGKSMPLDADATERGDFYIAEGKDGKLEGHHRGGYPGKLPEDVPLYTSHFSTCPHADSFRRSR